ncbi:MAG: PaaI family thioesterase [Candidatus Eremiobacteraeota bacterium]|nr:PaaI family thioesterase [Candidatus Eremiobacteraeota bacterium]
MSSPPLDFERAIERWDKQKANFIKTLDLHLIEVSRGKAAMRMPFRSQIQNGAGAIHGGAIVSLCDTVFWVALASIYGPEQPTATASLSCSFLRPALPPEDLVARATVLKPGARIVYGEVHVYSGDKLVAHATLSFLNSSAGDPRGESPAGRFSGDGDSEGTSPI